jgi:putative membrane protein
MWRDALLGYIHFVAIFTLFACLAVEWSLLGAGVERLDPRRLVRADLGYLIAAIAVLASGLARALAGAKPWVFYAGNPGFHLKLGLFVLVGLVSIAPTVAFLRWRRAAAADANFRVAPDAWRCARRLVLIELHLVAAIPLLAALMARGIGLSG